MEVAAFCLQKQACQAFLACSDHALISAANSSTEEIAEELFILIVRVSVSSPIHISGTCVSLNFLRHSYFLFNVLKHGVN
ncbi:hypothetical protein PCO86_11535 [Pectobacteriaceae bacterium CE70]|uniref:hypothetical protein n=1 Tax=Serratia sp. (strain ATCC 39006) TaxID=104623 RepID=UPI000413CBF7|nr:hypothetical protein [Serratia sp. ATCC 39006]WJV64977.1 hypothetical protein PCO86_11535 [Pectobacteriaceae bacterium CE70]WJY08997.1 hypothetical protein PCO80_11395 [Pectobacteriaceae bacterium C80]